MVPVITLFIVITQEKRGRKSLNFFTTLNVVNEPSFPLSVQDVNIVIIPLSKYSLLLLLVYSMSYAMLSMPILR